ncbi:MAG: riboflavin synthase [Planctomycetes bacterium]|nr:riboflavin synthase [Planctomycetota bacterium]
MFTGIVETVGSVVEATPGPRGARLLVDVGALAGECSHGCSVSIAGVCLTVSAVAGNTLEFDVVAESLGKSALADRRKGDQVNVERALRVGDRLDGHFVQGHVDGLGRVLRVESAPSNWRVWIRPEAGVRAYLIPKGSVAIDGVSLTIAEVRDDSFAVALIPTTLKETTLRSLRVGDAVNIESDIITRSAIHYLRNTTNGGALTMDTLRKAGFA